MPLKPLLRTSKLCLYLYSASGGSAGELTIKPIIVYLDELKGGDWIVSIVRRRKASCKRGINARR